MKYDDAEYYFLNFETDERETSDGATHIGMFFAWNALRGLASEEMHGDELAPVRARQITGRDFVVDQSDCKLFDEDLSPEGNAFAEWYYESRYLGDYMAVFGVSDQTADELCSVADTWENFDRLAPVLDKRFAEWKAAH